MRALITCLAVIATLTTFGGSAHATDTGPSPAYTVLDEAASQLREDFNRAKGWVGTYVRWVPSGHPGGCGSGQVLVTEGASMTWSTVNERRLRHHTPGRGLS